MRSAPNLNSFGHLRRSRQKRQIWVCKKGLLFMNFSDPICLFCQELLRCPNKMKFGANLTHQIIYHTKKWNFLNFSSIPFDFFREREQLSPCSEEDFRSLALFFEGNELLGIFGRINCLWALEDQGMFLFGHLIVPSTLFSWVFSSFFYHSCLISDDATLVLNLRLEHTITGV